MDPIVVASGAGVSLGGRPVLREIDFELASGSVIGVHGPNGSGKTTLLRLAATLLPPDKGSVRVMGAIAGSPGVHDIRTGIGLIGHTPALIPELTIGENLSHMAALAGIDRPSVARALSVVGLDEAAGVRVDASSHGMQRRVEIAALLMRRTRLLLLDEATSGLDHEATRLVDVLVERTIAAGGGVIMVSHDKGRLAGCHTLLEISGGRWPAQP